MKLKKCIFIVLVILFATAFFTYSQDNDYPTIDNSVFDNPQRPAAIFDHDTHNELAELEEDCAHCHHVYQGNILVKDESSEDTACNECHALEPTAENSVPLRRAFHQQCKKCHFERAKGPVLCAECHVKIIE